MIPLKLSLNTVKSIHSSGIGIFSEWTLPDAKNRKVSLCHRSQTGPGETEFFAICPH